jgi:hypothetical protein
MLASRLPLSGVSAETPQTVSGIGGARPACRCGRNCGRNGDAVECVLVLPRECESESLLKDSLPEVRVIKVGPLLFNWRMGGITFNNQ